MFEALRSLFGWNCAPVAATRTGTASPGAQPASVPVVAASASAASQSSWLSSVLFVLVGDGFLAFAVRRTLAAARRRDPHFVPESGAEAQADAAAQLGARIGGLLRYPRIPLIRARAGGSLFDRPAEEQDDSVNRRISHIPVQPP